VGERRGYKNFVGVAPALAEVMRQDPAVHLVCFGGGSLAAEEMAAFKTAGVAQRVIATRGTDGDLAWAYAHAAAFVFPSLYEGFGMPILEAMTNRCPVVLAQCSCFPEIAADAALYFDPVQPDDLVEILNRVLRDRQLQHRLGEAGVQRVADFSWRRSVREHAALYRMLAS
jgi:glycosyltransferase involved in cell wall biosynthesis